MIWLTLKLVAHRQTDQPTKRPTDRMTGHWQLSQLKIYIADINYSHAKLKGRKQSLFKLMAQCLWKEHNEELHPTTFCPIFPRLPNSLERRRWTHVRLHIGILVQTLACATHGRDTYFSIVSCSNHCFPTN